MFYPARRCDVVNAANCEEKKNKNKKASFGYCQTKHFIRTPEIGCYTTANPGRYEEWQEKTHRTILSDWVLEFLELLKIPAEMLRTFYLTSKQKEKVQPLNFPRWVSEFPNFECNITN